MGDASKAKGVLGWESKVSFEELVREMVIADLELNEPGSSEGIMKPAKVSSR
jgi:GDP-D-mannose dehydratase